MRAAHTFPTLKQANRPSMALPDPNGPINKLAKRKLMRFSYQMEISMRPGIRPQPGSVISYDDGRPGHQGILASVISVDEQGMLVQFQDRADTTRISFSDKKWMDFLSIVP
jgi:hypothetical protein